MFYKTFIRNKCDYNNFIFLFSSHLHLYLNKRKIMISDVAVKSKSVRY